MDLSTTGIAMPCATALEWTALLQQPWVWILVAVFVAAVVLIGRNIHLRVSLTRTLEVGRRKTEPSDTRADAGPRPVPDSTPASDPPSETPSADAAEPTGALSVCGACKKQLRTQLEAKGQCEHPGCSAAICQTCWIGQGKRACAEHA